MAAIDIPAWQPPDLFGAVLGAIKAKGEMENAKTQKLFAENTMRRQSAEDYRNERDFKERQAEHDKKDKIDAARALIEIGNMSPERQAGPGAALGAAYGIDVHPLMATVPGAHEAPPAAPVDPVDAALAEAIPPHGPAAPDMSNELPAEARGEPPREAAVFGLQNEAPNAHDAELESMMTAATAKPDVTSGGMAPVTAGDVQHTPQNPLYEAVMGGRHYALPGGPQSPGLGPKYDAIFKSYMSQPGVDAPTAFKAVLGAKEKDDAQSATEHRLMAAVGARNAETEKTKALYNLTADQQIERNRLNRENAMAVARMRAAMQGATTSPLDQQNLAKLIALTEEGAPKSEVAAAAAGMHLNPKVWESPVHQVGQEANQNTRTTERRAGLEFQDEFGNKGVAASPQAATELRTQADSLHRVVTRMDDLINHVEKYGSRIDLNSQEYQDRLSMGAGVNAALRPYNKLGGTDASQRLEAEITGALGAPGHGYLIGANIQGLKRIRAEALEQYNNKVKLNLRAGGGAPLAPAVTHQSGGASSKLTPAQQQNLPSGWSVAE